MIGSLRGLVLDKNPSHDRGVGDVLIEAAGVGYLITVTLDTLAKMVEDKEEFLFVYHHIREADQKLFGFLQKQERQAFEGLLSAHGVGPSLALAVLATHPVDELARILDDEDVSALCDVPGVGKKTAQRLLVELKSSLVLPNIDSVNPNVDLRDAATQPSSIKDVREALENFGYSSDEIKTVIADVRGRAEDTDSGDLLKLALRSLAGS